MTVISEISVPTLRTETANLIQQLIITSWLWPVISRQLYR